MVRKTLQEDVLREVERLVVVAEQVKRQLVDHPLVVVDEFGVRVLVARAQRWISADSLTGNFRPAEC